VVTSLDNVRDVALTGDRLFVAAGSQGLHVFHIVHGPRPTEVAVVEPLSAAGGLILGSGLLVVSNGSFGGQVVAWEEGSPPEAIASFRLPGSLSLGRGRLDERGRLFAAADRGGLAVIDLAVPRSPRVLIPRERKMKVTQPE
jgi:hypothetical protein